MGTSSHMRKGSAAAARPKNGASTGDPRPIVAFDFDGTLSVRDSFVAFLRQRVSGPRFILGMVKLAPAALRYGINQDRNDLKTATVAEFLTGLSRAKLEVEAKAFADKVWDGFMRADALATWADWGERGAQRVIVTASPQTLIAPFAQRLGADRLIGTRLRFDADDRVAGDFVGVNCRGPEKVNRLRAEFGPDVKLAAAYGDSAGDVEMMGLAEIKGMKVFTAGG
jgi:phosphatidylglycerophosphatase C